MKRWKMTALLALVMVTLCAGQNKSPAYFYDTYGAPKKEKNASSVLIFDGKNLIEVKGTYVTRNYESGKMRVEATFEKPSLTLIQVKYMLPEAWNREQTAAALKAYSNKWETQAGPAALLIAAGTYVSDNGYSALLSHTVLTVITPRGKTIFDEAKKKKEEKRKEVPKF